MLSCEGQKVAENERRGAKGLYAGETYTAGTLLGSITLS